MADFNPAMLSRQQMSSSEVPPLAAGARRGMWGARAAPITGPVGPAPWDQNVVMPDEDRAAAPYGRTDFTQDIDGAFAQRNAGSKHWSEVARSGNGDMTTDLQEEDDKDYTEIDGLGEQLECLSLVESTRVDGLGAAAAIPKFRWPRPGETPPFAPTAGKTWVRRKVVTASRQPGGNRVAKVKWALMSKSKVAQSIKSGDLPGGVNGLGGLGMSMETMGISTGIGIAGGLLLWFFLLRKKR